MMSDWAVGGRRLTVAFGVLAALAPSLATAAAADVFYERTVMSAADQRCRLFTPGISSALSAGRVQARGAALRAGVQQSELGRIETRARNKAAAQNCNSRDLQTAATRVRSAFEGYSRLLKMDYPGDIAGWTAERTASKTGMVWNLSQPVMVNFDPMVFGLAGKDGRRQLIAAVRFADGARPYAARIVMRDVTRVSGPYLDRQRATKKGGLPLSARVAPKVMTVSYLAESRITPDPLLLTKNMKGAIGYRFPAAAAAAIAELDPREAIEVEFLFDGRGGDTLRRGYVEVGDFAAGRAFLTVGAT